MLFLNTNLGICIFLLAEQHLEGTLFQLWVNIPIVETRCEKWQKSTDRWFEMIRGGLQRNEYKPRQN